MSQWPGRGSGGRYGHVTAWLIADSELRENKHYFSVCSLTFDFEGRDLRTLSLATLHDPEVVNYLKVVVQTTLLTENM